MPGLGCWDFSSLLEPGGRGRRFARGFLLAASSLKCCPHRILAQHSLPGSRRKLWKAATSFTACPLPQVAAAQGKQ